MKNLLALALVMTLAAATALAGPPEGRGDPEQRLAKMQQQLSLSDEQVQQIRENHANGGGREGMREILTENQREQFQQMRREHKGKGNGKGGRPGSTHDASQSAEAP
jgi:Spy/CpxP family protein refolding chaperone